MFLEENSTDFLKASRGQFRAPKDIFFSARIDRCKESRAGKSGGLQIYKIIKFHKCAAGLLSTIKRLIFFCRVRKIPRARKNARGIFINFAP